MSAQREKKTGYRTCECEHTWNTRDDFLNDKKVVIIGYQPDFINHKYNHFLFSHLGKSCGQLFGIRASDFSDLREKGCAKELCIGQDHCPGYCHNSLDLRICSVACRNASDRMLAAKIRSRRILRRLMPEVMVSGGSRRTKPKVGSSL